MGNHPTLAVLLSDSWIRVQVGTSTEARVVVDMAGQGHLVSVQHAVDPQCPSWLGQVGDTYGIALGRGTILQISAEVMPVLFSDLPNLNRLIMKLLNAHLHFAIQLRASGSLDVNTRLARLLLVLRHRFGEHPATRALAPPLSQLDLASWIGASHASVARVMRQWRQAGVIRTSRSRITVLDWPALHGAGFSSTMPLTHPPSAHSGTRNHLSTAVLEAVRHSASGRMNLNADLPPGMESR